jgi:hypothetical protein
VQALPALAAKQCAALLHGGLPGLAVAFGLIWWTGWRAKLLGDALAAGCTAGVLTSLLCGGELFAGSTVAFAPAQGRRGELLQAGGQVGRILVLAAGLPGLLVLAGWQGAARRAA